MQNRAYLAICAIFRNEAAYLDEWIRFHRLVGVEHFFLYDNASDDEFLRVLRPFIDQGLVTLVSWPVPYHLGAQRRAFDDCLDRVRGQVRWLACIDIDEFLFSPCDKELAAALADYERYPGVVVRWQVYGSSGHQRASSEPVISRFLRRAPTSWIRNRRVKSIVDPERALRTINPHLFVYRDGGLAVTELEEPVGVRRTWISRLRRHPWLSPLLSPMLPFVDPYAAKDVSSRAISVERLRINHYPVKSREEYLRKTCLGELRRYEGIDYFAYHDRNEIHDPILLPWASA